MDKPEKDIVETLKDLAAEFGSPIYTEAAKEIEALREIVRVSRSTFGTCDVYSCRKDTIEESLTTGIELCAKHVESRP